jgi:hypothetical protein
MGAALVAEAEREYGTAERPDALARGELRRWARSHRLVDSADRR